MIVPPKVRPILVTRNSNNDDVLRALTVPVLNSQSRSDTVGLPDMRRGNCLMVSVHGASSIPRRSTASIASWLRSRAILHCIDV